MKKNITIRQATILRELGFKETTLGYAYRLNEKCRYSILSNPKYDAIYSLSDINNKQYLLIPDIDQAIDWIRRKFNVIVYNTAAPYVDPIDHKIRYGYRIKVCNTKFGWNQRVYIDVNFWSQNIHSAKSKALTKALQYIRSRYRKLSTSDKHNKSKQNGKTIFPVHRKSKTTRLKKEKK